MSGRAQWLKWIPGAAVLALFVWLYRSSLVSMWDTWGASETYAHGYIIFPIAAFLIWRRRHDLALAPHRPHWIAAVALGVLGIMWAVAHLMSVQVVEQAMFVAMMITGVLALYGSPVFKVILFPLFYLGFAVPMGEVFVPHLMEFTADFSVAALKATGIPVYRDGMYFSIPSGDFEVAWACSGIRYLMASFCLGTLYAYLSYRSFKKQVIFSLFSLIVPIIANAIRAYGIVIIAHLSKLKHAVGVDHLIYGWLFFGFIMFILFYVGGKFRREEDFEPQRVVSPDMADASSAKMWTTIAVSIAALVLPAVLLQTTLKAASGPISEPLLPAAVDGWSGPHLEVSGFTSELINAEHVITGRYQHADGEVQLWIYRYRPFVNGKEMINETNKLSSWGNWRQIDWSITKRTPPGSLPSVNEFEMKYAHRESLLWQWYQINDDSAASKIHGKILEGATWLSGELELNEAIVLVSVPGRSAAERAALEHFVSAHLPAISACMFSDSKTDGCQPGYVVE